LHIDHLNAAGRVGERLARILELGFAISDRYQIAADDAEFAGQIVLDRVRPPLFAALSRFE
jgi:hypothetical protein